MARQNVRRNAMEQVEVLEGRVAELRTQIRRQMAINAEAEAKLVLYDIVRGQKDIRDVPRELLVDLNKLMEKRMQEVAACIDRCSL